MSFNKIPQSPSVVCFGEVLWDIFPEGQKAGGAPFNVAYNLHQQGINSHIVSAVGNDDLGRQLTQQIKEWCMPVTSCQTDNGHPTGTVMATIDEHNEAHYDIVTNVAWDYIVLTEENKKLVTACDAFVYGSLAARNETSKSTLFKLLEIADYKVFDINLRPPFYSIELLIALMQYADLVKTNKAELRLILELMGLPFTTEEEAVRLLQQRFGITEFLLTKGSRGAAYYNREQHLEYPAIPITIQDTVGSGDSFLSGFLAKKVIGTPAEEAMQNALTMGAFITTKTGACPPYTLEEFTFLRNKIPLS